MGYSILERAVTLLTPFECAICGREGNMLCGVCAENHIGEQISRCYLCNKLTAQHRTCRSCHSRLGRVWWLGSYKNALKELIYSMKYQRNRGYARQLGDLLAETIPYLPAQTLIISAPTAPKRIRQRGFDQAALIAQQVAAHHKLNYKPLLYRATQVDQIGKNRTQRYEQMRGSVKIHKPEQIQGKSILLIDDVLTTGATLEVTARILRENGAAHVDAAVVARHLLG